MKEIKLTQGQVAIVDDADHEWLSQFKWYALKRKNTFYAVRNTPRGNGKRRTIGMHQMIIGNGADHKDGDGLNNTRANLRPATVQQNNCNRRTPTNNTSGYKGVNWRKERNKWRAEIRLDGKTIHLGYFTNLEAAARAYDRKAIELFGEYSRLNFPQEG